MGLKKGSSAPSYLDLFQPLSQETWREEGNCREDRRPAHMQRYWLMNRRNNADPSGISDQQYEMALALCEICQVQWQCVSFALRNRDKFHIWAVDRDDRKVLRSEKDWQSTIDLAQLEQRSVRSVVLAIRTRRAEMEAEQHEVIVYSVASSA